MAKLSQIVRNLADIVVEIDGTDDDGNPIKVPVTVTYRPRLMTLAFRDQFGRHLAVLNKADFTANGKPVPLPLPKTAEEMQAFVAPEMMRAVMEAVMAALNPNRKAGEQSAKDSPAT